MKHQAILLHNTVDKEALIRSILTGTAAGALATFSHKKGALFSDIAVEELIRHEERLDMVKVAVGKDRKLRTFSAGERKKEFLKYCLSQNPDFLILDNPLDHLDIASRNQLIKSLGKIGMQIPMIQLSNRKADFLPFIHCRKQIIENSFVLHLLPTQNGEEISKPVVLPEAFFVKHSAARLVHLDGVSVRYAEHPILDNISWEIRQGEFWQLIGPNGSGKSTLLSMITGENPKGYGQNMYLFGKKKGTGESVWEIKKKIGYFSPAITELFERRSTLEEMVLSGFFDTIGLYDRPTLYQKQQVSKWLSLVNMQGKVGTIFQKLSQGQQRVALIIRALLKEPPLLILDEPVEGLDDHNAAIIIQLINTLMYHTNITTVFVSHRIEPNLNPTSVFELTPGIRGSTGLVKEFR